MGNEVEETLEGIQLALQGSFARGLESPENDPRFNPDLARITDRRPNPDELREAARQFYLNSKREPNELELVWDNRTHPIVWGNLLLTTGLSGFYYFHGRGVWSIDNKTLQIGAACFGLHYFICRWLVKLIPLKREQRPRVKRKDM